MSTQKTSWILELIDKLSSPMDKIIGKTEEGKKKTDNWSDSLKGMSAIDLSAIAGSIDNILGKMEQVSAPGIAFDSAKKEMQAITQMSDAEIDKIGKNARKSAKQFGLDASEMAGSYTGLIARFGPEIAQNDAALAGMGNNIATLSKLMKNDTEGAMDAATTAMLQFDVALEDPMKAAKEMTRMINVMAAAGNEGASEVDMTSEALKAAGVQAKNSNVSFEETNATLQALAQGGLYGSEAGTKLRNVLANMAGVDVIPRQAAEKLKAWGVNYDIVSDKTLPLTDRLRELKKAQGDATVMAQVFGIQNESAAQILLNSVDAIDEMTAKISGTNAAFESAEIIMGSYEERMARMKAWWNDLGISIFGATQYVLPFVTVIGMAVMTLANLANARTGIVLLMTTLKTMPVVGTIVSGAFNLMSLGAKGLGTAIMSIPIIGWIAAVIAGLVALGTYLWNTSAEFRSVLMGIWEFVKTFFTGIGSFIGEVMDGIWHLIKGVFNPKNWFDDSYSFGDGLKKISDAASTYGESMGKAFAEGREKGMESFYNDNPDKRPTITIGQPSKDLSLSKSQLSPVIPPKNLDNNLNKGGSGLSGSGGVGGVKNITQRIEIKNYFNVDNNTNVNTIAEKVISVINSRLRDSTTVAGQ